MTQYRIPVGRAAACLALTSTLLLGSCAKSDAELEAARAAAEGQASTAGAQASSDPAAANLTSDQAAAGQDSAKAAGAEAGPSAGGANAKPADFTPPPARRVPSANPAIQRATPDAGVGAVGPVLPGSDATLQPNKPQEPPMTGERMAELKQFYLGQGLSEEEVLKRLEQHKAGSPTPVLPKVQTDPNAKLVVDFGNDSHDFGRARQGDQLSHTFEMTAGGTAPLKIRQVSPTCGCTVGEVKVEDSDGELVEYQMGDAIEPGRKILVEAVLNSASKRNRTQVRINVYHNDPVGLTTFSLAADIEPFITVTPPFMNFGEIKQGETRTQNIDIRTSRGERIALAIDNSRPIPMPAGLEIELTPTAPDEAGRAAHWKAQVTIGPEAAEGSLGYQLAMVTDVEMPADPGHAIKGAGEKTGAPVSKFHTANASVSASILGALSHNPQFLSMGLVRPGQVVPRTVKVTSHDPEFDLSGVSASLRGEKGADLPFAQHFKTTVKPSAGGNAVDVELRLTGLPEGSDGSFRGELVIETGHPEKSEIVVRFSGVCRAGVR